MAQLQTPRLTVILADPDAPPDVDEGREVIVQTRNVELCAFDRDRGKYGWPKGEDAPFLWLTYLAWRALMRTGQIDKCSLADFENVCLSVSSDQDGRPVDPTRPAVTAG